MKKGFTLVELLAVIAILAILVILAMPNIMGMFNNAKERTFLTEVENVDKIAKTFFITNMGNLSSFDGKTNVYSQLSLSGGNQDEGIVKITKDGNTYVALRYDEKWYIKDFDDEDIKVYTNEEYLTINNFCAINKLVYLKDNSTGTVYKDDEFVIVGGDGENCNLVLKSCDNIYWNLTYNNYISLDDYNTDTSIKFEDTGIYKKLINWKSQKDSIHPNLIIGDPRILYLNEFNSLSDDYKRFCGGNYFIFSNKSDKYFYSKNNTNNILLHSSDFVDTPQFLIAGLYNDYNFVSTVSKGSNYYIDYYFGNTSSVCARPVIKVNYKNIYEI